MRPVLATERDEGLLPLGENVLKLEATLAEDGEVGHGREPMRRASIPVDPGRPGTEHIVKDRIELTTSGPQGALAAATLTRALDVDLVEVADAASFSGAARLLGTTTATVSRSIAKLEDAVGSDRGSFIERRAESR